MTYDPQAYNKADLRYDYTEIQARITEGAWSHYCEQLRPKWAALTRSWDTARNVEWIVREYFAIKMVLGASLLLGSMRYSETANLQVVVPYLAYYGLFNAARAWVFLLPHQDWGARDQILTMTHQSVHNIVVTEARRINASLADWLDATLVRARASRELFSYRFPTGGPSDERMPETLDAIRGARLFAELAQSNSEMLSRALDQRGIDENVAADANDRRVLFAYQHEVANQRRTILDWDDRLRIDQLLAKERRPYDLVGMARPGLLDDFFGAWLLDPEMPNPDAYDPDGDNRLLLHFN